MCQNAVKSVKTRSNFAVTIPKEKAEVFKRFCHLLGDRPVTEFNYRYVDKEQACIFVGVRISSEKEKLEIIQQLEQNDYKVMDL